MLRSLLSGSRRDLRAPRRGAGRAELTVRTDGSHAYWFLVNRTDEPVAFGTVDGEILTGPSSGAVGLILPPRGVAVLRVASGSTPFRQGAA